MSWLTLLLAVLLPAGIPSSPAASSPRQAAAAPVRPRLCRESSPCRLDAAPGAVVLKSVDHRRPQVANRRLSERRTVPLAKALVRSGLPHDLTVAAPAGESDRRIAPQGPVPDPIERYARIIFPVPPPLR